MKRLAPNNKPTNKLQLTAELDRTLVWTKGDSVRYLLVEVQAPTAAPKQPSQSAGLNLGLVIDASGSMAGAPLTAAKEAAAGLHLEAIPATADGQRQALLAISAMASGSSTNLSGGWLAGATCVARQMEHTPAGQHRVIVLSDGWANEGLTEPAVLARHAAALAQRGLYSSTVGIGDDYSTEQLRAIADHGGGRLHDADRPEEIVEVLLGELGELQTTVAEQVALAVVAPAGVQVEVLGPYPTTADGIRTVCNLGSLPAGSTRSVLCKLQTPPGTAGQGRQYVSQAVWQPVGSAEVLRTATVTSTLTYAPAAANSAQERLVAVSQAVAQLWHAHVVQQAAVLNEQERYRDARGYVSDQLNHFRRYCRGLSGTRSVVAELKQLLAVAAQAWSSRTQKEVRHQQYKQQRGESDHRSVPRQPWNTYLPAVDCST